MTRGVGTDGRGTGPGHRATPAQGRSAPSTTQAAAKGPDGISTPLPTIPSEKLETHLKGKGRKTGEKHVNKTTGPGSRSN